MNTYSEDEGYKILAIIICKELSLLNINTNIKIKIKIKINNYNLHELKV